MAVAAQMSGPAGAATSVQGRKDVRFIGDVMGSYVLASRAQTVGAVQVFACRARSISPFEAVINAPVAGPLGDGLIVTFQGLGIIRGKISRVLDGGFAVSFECSDSERNLLGARIDWLKRKALKAVIDRRAHRRVLPRETKARLILGDGTNFDCFIIDMSQSGVAVSADVLPPLGSPAGVGGVPGKVVRHIPTGFAIQFAELQPMDRIEALLTLRTGPDRVLAAEHPGIGE